MCITHFQGNFLCMTKSSIWKRHFQILLFHTSKFYVASIDIFKYWLENKIKQKLTLNIFDLRLMENID